MSTMRPHDRRRHPRVEAGALSFLTAHLSGGAAVSLVDVSHRGVRLETTRHMRPGQTVCVRFALGDETVSVNASVLRATVKHLHAETVRYETALQLVEDATAERFQLALAEQRRIAHETQASPAEPLPPGVAVVLVGEAPQARAATDTSHQGWWLSGPRKRRRSA